MLDANALEPGARIDADVCIIGAGASGITLARALAGDGIEVALLESGGMDFESDTQKLADVINRQPQYVFEGMRLRYFGGSTNHWGGWCRPLDEMDFRERPWVRDSGWPITRADLDPYYPKALSILDVPPRLYGATLPQVADDIKHKPSVLGADHPDFRPLVWLRSAPTRMRTKYGDDIRANPRIRCFLHANAMELMADANGAHVLCLKVRTLAGRESTCIAKLYVLCAGGIENARLLLLSDSVVAGGLGNRHDLVGRYLMEHTSTPAPGWLVLAPPRGSERFQEEDLCHRSRDGRLPGVNAELFGFAARPAFQRTHKLLGCSINALGAPVTDAEALPGAIRDLVGSRHGPSASPSAAAQLPRAYRILVLAEHAPNPNSRVSLSSERDTLGQRKTVVDVQFQEQDRRSIRESLECFARAVGASGHGRVQLNDGELFYGGGGGHDMGTTRMADDPRHGVTDRHGKVHGVDNLFLAGSSLFSTSGSANPTLTLVALTLRIADRLKGIVRTVRR
jgi:choline dehydrogenase-like flavoprotein